VAAEALRVIGWVAVAVLGAGFLVIAGFWVWAIVTGGKYM
jgi:hypothetical protein